MAGHSKWKQIKHKKALTDAKKGTAFSKMARMITVVVKEKGTDLDTNTKLRTAVEKARALGMPMANIERAIGRGAGTTNEAALEEVLYEAYGPGGAAFLIEGITDSKNRTTSEIKHLLSEHDGRLAAQGSVEWLFAKTYTIEYVPEKGRDEEALELALIDAGATDIQKDVASVAVFTDPAAADAVKQVLFAQKIAITGEGPERIAKNYVPIHDAETKQHIIALYEALDDHDDVQAVCTNVQL